jgi:hypothetical protein
MEVEAVWEVEAGMVWEVGTAWEVWVEAGSVGEGWRCVVARRRQLTSLAVVERMALLTIRISRLETMTLIDSMGEVSVPLIDRIISVIAMA